VIELVVWACLTLQAPDSTNPDCITVHIELEKAENIRECEQIARRMPLIETDTDTYFVLHHECKRLEKA
jgi:hypothetical protein